jgi:hypothetical protein
MNQDKCYYLISSAKPIFAIPQPITHRPFLRSLFQQSDFVCGQYLRKYHLILKTAIDIAGYLGTKILGLIVYHQYI